MNDKTETILWILCITVLILLGVRTVNVGEEKDCNQCTITLKEQRVLGEFVVFGEYKIMDLFYGLAQQNTCIVKWDKTEGYYEAYERIK